MASMNFWWHSTPFFVKQLVHLKWGMVVHYVYKIFEASDWSRWGYSHRFSESHSAAKMTVWCHVQRTRKVVPCWTAATPHHITLCGLFLWRKLWWSSMMQVIKLPSFMSLQVAIYILLVVGNCLSQANSPLLLEFTVEVCYPVSEVISGGWIFLGWVWNLLTNKSNK